VQERTARLLVIIGARFTLGDCLHPLRLAYCWPTLLFSFVLRVLYVSVVSAAPCNQHHRAENKGRMRSLHPRNLSVLKWANCALWRWRFRGFRPANRTILGGSRCNSLGFLQYGCQDRLSGGIYWAEGN